MEGPSHRSGYWHIDGLGGFLGSYTGDRLQSRLPEQSLRKLVAARYTQTAVQGASARPDARKLERQIARVG
jgi:hypothetical protein